MMQITDEARLSRKELLRQAYARAAQDAAYQAEMAEIDRAFDSTVSDGLTTPAADYEKRV
jgi:hypothetical protein